MAGALDRALILRHVLCSATPLRLDELSDPLHGHAQLVRLDTRVDKAEEPMLRVPEPHPGGQQHARILEQFTPQPELTVFDGSSRNSERSIHRKRLPRLGT